MPSRIGHGKGMEQHNDPGKALRCRWRSLRRTAKQKDSRPEGDRASDRHRGDHGRHDRIEPHLTVRGIRPDR